MENTLPKIRFGSEVLSDLERAMSLEWVMTNGLGGYASSNVLGINTRKYHGILVASFNPPVDRRVVLSKLDEQLLIDGEVYPLGANEFSHGIYPQGYKYLESFLRFPFPTFTYNTDKVRLRKTILVPHQKNATVVFYKISSPPKERITLQIYPLVNSRHFHAVIDKNKLGWSFVQRTSAQKTTLQIADPQSTLILSSCSGQYIEGGKWVEGMFFKIDSSQGNSCFDDCYVPGRFEIDLKPSGKTEFHVVAVVGKKVDNAKNVHFSICRELKDSNSFRQKELNRLTSLLTKFHDQHPNVVQENWLKCLILATDSFIVNRSTTNTKTVIAGYHWFEDWGRDSLISLPGLTLVTGRFTDAREILLTFKHYCSNGIIPNRFPDKAGKRPDYNTVDATLWHFNAVLQYLKYTGDFNFVKQKLWTTLQSVIDYHIQGTINNIHLDDDGLIMHGPQLTWMDAMIDNNPVTPREGKAVEIQALWYNALKIMELLATRFRHNDLAEKYRGIAEKAKKSFVEKFWNTQKKCLFDVINSEVKDASLRPNQIFAVSLDFSMLDEAEQTAIVSVVQEKLWATYGLKTLSADEPKYRGKYFGNWAERNYAYHNGTAWPWLIGPFVTAFLKVKNSDANYRRFAFENFLQPLFKEQMLCAGLGTLSEVFDGDLPYLPGGCISQAWSVAEPLRVYVEDVLFERPSFERDVLENFSSKETK
ncbi:MAG: glycogen debranching enzyme N-terminal domain-containing protein [Candidatus Bathyarchaeota archaeon]|nr:glycogen debranching enzyme N-terminal domain-containing protein [Candidatus Bathyarchaeota archaeon]